MTPVRLLASCLCSLAAAVAVAQDGRPPVPQPRIKMESQGNLSAKDRAVLDEKLAALIETRRKEKAADLADMHAQRAASTFDRAKGEFETHPNGMLWRDLVVGEGEPIGWGDQVETHYDAWYLDGRKLDSSRDREQIFRVKDVGEARVIKAFDAALMGMRAGGKRLVVLPSQLGYGKSDSPMGVPGGSHLIYEIEVLKIDFVPRRPDLAQLKLTKNASGLHWTDVRVGDGRAIEKGSMALIHYSGWLADSDEPNSFDSSFEMQQPFPFQNIGEADLIAGWNEGVIGMKAGGRRVLLVPPELGYGAEGRGEAIPPNARLLFLVEAFSVFPKKPATRKLELTTNDTGLQWADLAVGKGAAIGDEEHVDLHFTGWLDEGMVFDSTYFAGVSAELPGVVHTPLPEGVKEGLRGMKPGGTRVLVVPPELGFGETGIAKQVPPNSTLTILLEVFGVEPPPSPLEVQN